MGTILSSLISVSMLILNTTNKWSSSSIAAHDGLALPRPNPYVNLEQALKVGDHNFPPISNFPEVILQTDPLDPSRRMTEDERGRHTHVGFVYPDDRHFLATSQVGRNVLYHIHTV